MRPTRELYLALLAVAFATSSALGQCPAGLSDCATATCAGGCPPTGIVLVSHLNIGFLGESGFDLRTTSRYADSCTDPNLPNGCPIQSIPPVRVWAFDVFNDANGGCRALYDPATLDQAIVSQYDVLNGQPSGLWWLFNWRWANQQAPGLNRVDGCIQSVVGPGSRRTVVEISEGDGNSGEGTTAHDSWYLIAGAGENNSSWGIYDFEEIRGAGGAAGNTIAVTSVPDIRAITNAGVGNPTCPGDYGAASLHPLNAVDSAYFDVRVAVSDTSPPYFNEVGLNAGSQLIAGLQILYARGPAPTTGAIDSPQDISTAVWLPARHPAAPSMMEAALIPHLGPDTLTVSLPESACSAGCFLAARIIYRDATANPGTPGPFVIGAGPVLGSWTGQQCGPVRSQGASRVNLVLTKTRTSPPIVSPAGTVSFAIVVENTGFEPHVGTLGDLLDPCFAPLGMSGSPCPTGPGAPSVSCFGNGCLGAGCTLRSGGFGFDFGTFLLMPYDGLPGGDDEIQLSVDVIADWTLGPCANTANTFDPTDGTINSSATVVIGSACSVVAVVQNPVIMRLPPPWVYTTVCGATDSRLANTTVVASVAAGSSVDTADGVAPGAPGQLRLYQLDCSCGNNVHLVKNANTNFVAVHVAP